MEARKIIITGGATRIGAAIAEKLSGPNKEIIIHYNQSKSKAEKLKKKLQKFAKREADQTRNSPMCQQVFSLKTGFFKPARPPDHFPRDPRHQDLPDHSRLPLRPAGIPSADTTVPPE